MFVIDHSTPNDVLFPSSHRRGYDPATVAKGMFARPGDMTLIPRPEWDARIAERERTRSGLKFVRETMANGGRHKSYDQNGQGFCWAYSTGAAVTYARGRDGAPYRRLSPHAVACKIKNFRDEGGWCGLSAQFARENGYPTEAEWPAKSMSRSYDTAATWAAAANNKVVEEWFDLTHAVYDQTMTFDMVATQLLLNNPVQCDFNWWSHSVCAIDLVRIEAGSYGLLIHNSWADSWGDAGTGVLRGSQAIPDNAVSSCVVTAA